MSMLIPRTGESSTASKTQHFDELNKNLRHLTRAVCCNTEANTVINDTELIPMYEYQVLYAPYLIYQNVDMGFDYDNISNEITFTWTSNVSQMCDAFTVVSDTVVNNLRYTDSLGREINVTPSTTISYAGLEDVRVIFRLEVPRASGYVTTFEGFYDINNTSSITVFAISTFYSNTNARHYDSIAGSGLLPTPYEVPVQEFFALYQNGVFVDYVDSTGAVVVPTYCVSTAPVAAFPTLSLSPLAPQFNKTEHVYLNAAALAAAIPGGTVNSISYSITSGTADVTIGTTTHTLPVGVSATLESNSLLTEAFDIDASSGQAYIIIRKP